MSAAALRLTDTQPEPSAPAPPTMAVPMPAPRVVFDAAAQAEAAESSLRRQLTMLSDELSVLQKRDEIFRTHVHRIDEELRLAARLQRDFLPKSLPAVGPIRFHTLFRPAGHVSGDIYDVMRLDETHVGFYVVDAVGHGMPAALLTMFLKNAMATKEIRPDGYRLLEPHRTIAKLNDALIAQNLSNATFATALYGHVDVRTLRVTFARGGHPNPVVVSRDGEMRTIGAEGSLLGIFPDETFADATIQLSRGDRLFVYSDGLELAFADERNLDVDRWKQVLADRAGGPTEDLIEAFRSHIDGMTKTQPLKDDLTLVVVEIV